MKLKEAYDILGINSNSSAEEIKKAYKKKVLECHPDINKSTDSENEIKLVNQAFQCVQSGKGDDPPPRSSVSNPFSGFGGPFSPFQRSHQPVEVEPIQINTTISFKESVLSVKKEIKFSRKVKCSECNGQGSIRLNNGCAKCGGRGQINGKQGMMIFVMTCDKCHGRTEVKDCNKCNCTGSLDSETTIQVTIPSGIQNNNVLRLGGMGHFIGDFMGSDQYTDVYLMVNVEQDPDMSIIDDCVTSNINISLLEALQGCNKNVRTVLGEKTIIIPPKAKHKDNILIPNVGINKGNQKVIVNVDYPDDVNSLINSLSNKLEKSE